jgi:hypothetical protein
MDDQVLTFTRWSDPIVEANGYDGLSEYVETFWLPVLGPTQVFLVRRLTSMLEGHGPDAPAVIPVLELAGAMGLAGSVAALMRALRRLRTFDLALTTDELHWQVMTTLPPLARRHAARLPVSLQAALADHQREQLRAAS